MQDQGKIPQGDDRAALDYAYSGAERALVVTTVDLDAARWERLWASLDIYLLDILSPERAVSALDRLMGVDMVWVELGQETVLPELIVKLQLLCARGSIRLVWVASGAGLDQGYAAFDYDNVQFLSQPTDIERYAEAAIMTSKRKFALHDSNESDVDQIHKLTEEVNRIAKLLAQMADRTGLPNNQDLEEKTGAQLRSPSYGYVAEPPFAESGFSQSQPDTIVTAGDIRQVIRARRLRDQFFPPEIFADPAWDMLLDLMAARISGAHVSVSSLCIAAAVPATTALRWIRTMTEAGLFIRHADPADGRRVYIGLSDEAADGMMRYFKEMKARPN